MLTIIFSWIVLFILISLVGMLFVKKVEWYEYFWAGFIGVIAMLQIWSIFLPVNFYTFIFITGLSLLSLIILLKKKRFKIHKINIWFVLAVGLVLLIISYYASLPSGWADTFGYHLNAVKWGNLYKAVPGLANLHSRLGFNSSFFLFASMLDNSLLRDRSIHIALSFITVIISVEFIWLFFKSKNKNLQIFILLVLPIVASNIVKTGQITSLSYDFALLIVILAICIELINGRKESLILAGALSIMLVTIKLSGTAFSLTVLSYIAYQFVFRKYIHGKSVLMLTLLGIVVIIPYMIRNIILSGWPLYPLPALKLNMSWAVPENRVIGLFEVIKAWAILQGSQYHNVIGLPIWQWFPGWYHRNNGHIEIKVFFLAIMFLTGSVFLKFKNNKLNKQNVGVVICLIASFASIIYLIFSAPDLRFGGIFFWVFLGSAGSLFLTEIVERHPRWEKLVFGMCILSTLYLSWPPLIRGEIMLKSIRWEQPLTYKQVEIVPKDGSESFKVFTPDISGSSDSCGNSELPCTPEVNNDFKEIVPGDISKGFAPVN